jgi:hypothetical protein
MPRASLSAGVLPLSLTFHFLSLTCQAGVCGAGAGVQRCRLWQRRPAAVRLRRRAYAAAEASAPAPAPAPLIGQRQPRRLEQRQPAGPGCITATNRIELVLFGMQNRTSSPAGPEPGAGDAAFAFSGPIHLSLREPRLPILHGGTGTSWRLVVPSRMPPNLSFFSTPYGGWLRCFLTV